MTDSLPDEWIKSNLGTILELKYGKALPAKKRDGKGAPVYGSNGIVGNHSIPLINTAGIVIGRKGSFGEVNLVNEAFSPIDTTYYIDELFELPIKYWFYQLKKLPLTSLNRSTAIPGLNRDDAYSQEIYFPPLAEQEEIVTQLDKLLAQVESIKARLDAIPVILKQFRQSVLSDAVSGKLTEKWRVNTKLDDAKKLIENIKLARSKTYETEISNGNSDTKRLKTKLAKHSFFIPESVIPRSWVWTSFMESLERVVDCHNKTAPYVGAGIKLIRTPDIKNGKISLDNTKFVDEDTYAYWSRRCIPIPKDVIFTREAPMGEAGIIPENTKVCMGQRLMLLRPMMDYILPKYLLLNIMSLPFQQRMFKSAIGTGVKHLRVADVESLTYPLTTYKEQTEIVRRVEELFTYADKIEQQVNAAQARVDNLTQSILAKAFSGELTAKWREKNPDLISGENSAQTLLEKIKTKREALAQAKKPIKKKKITRKAATKKV